MKFISSLALILIIFLCAGCPENTDPADSELVIINNSSEAIIHYYELKTPADTSLATIAYPQTPENTASSIINPNGSMVEKEGFKRILTNNPDKVLMLYLFSSDTIEQVP